MSDSKTIAAVFAHPDDEVLGCGASLARHAAGGETVRILILATGLASRGKAEAAELGALQDQARRAAGILGAAHIAFGEMLDNQMDTVSLLSVVQVVEEFFAEAPPAVVYTHHAGDLNVDHRVTHQAVLTALRPQPGTPSHEIRSCEVNSATEWSGPSFQPFVPTIFADITGTLEKKLEALRCYAGELRDWPHPRSEVGVETLARWRGAQCGHEAAEAFALVRRVSGA